MIILSSTLLEQSASRMLLIAKDSLIMHNVPEQYLLIPDNKQC